MSDVKIATSPVYCTVAVIKKAEMPILDAALEHVAYTCGSSMTDFIDSDILPDATEHNAGNILDRVFVRRDLRCVQPVEIPYYSSGLFEAICCFCDYETAPGYRQRN